METLNGTCTASTPNPVLDLSGEWLCRAGGDTPSFTDAATIQLPGTLDDFGIGEKVTDIEVGALSRKVNFTGKAWYRRDIEIPQEWDGMELELFLERVIWVSELWIDGIRVDSLIDSLATPHIHKIGSLAPGRHTVTLCIDNSMRHPIGDKGHAYCDYMQTIWNGVIGELHIRIKNPLNHLKIVSDWPATCLQLTLPAVDADSWLITLKDCSGGETVQHSELNFKVASDNILTAELNLEFEPKKWDEFSPSLYQITLTAFKGENIFAETETKFGFRKLERAGNNLYINNRQLFVRGNLDGCHFPLTGYPAMDIEGWKRIFQISKNNGINFIRFHSWCPPKAAFEAADEIGIYLHPELIWIDAWMPGGLKGLGNGDEELDSYVRRELRLINQTYGNFPSFISFCFGNELGSSNYEKMAEWIAEERKFDSRHLYSCSTARSVTAEDDFIITHNYPGVGDVRMRMYNNTDWDYEDVYSKIEHPCIGHEIGQWPVYPDWTEIDKYSGNLTPENLIKLRQLAEKNGTLNLNKLYHRVSRKQSIAMYKDEVESFMRTESCSGISLLGMQDYSGQGEALVGWYDSFYDNKGEVSPEDVISWLGPIVPLARFKKYCWRADEEFTAEISIRHNGEIEIPAGTEIFWTIESDSSSEENQVGKTIKTEEAIKPGDLYKVGDISLSLKDFSISGMHILSVRIDNTTASNRWPFWIFNSQISETIPDKTVLTDNLNEAKKILTDGGTVILDASSLGSKMTSLCADWGALTWSSTWFGGQSLETLGLCLDHTHPALADFPTDEHGDWQWWNICKDGKAFRLKGMPSDYRPIAMPVSDFHKSELLGTIFEFAVGSGRLLICGYDLSKENIETKHLKRSLINYVESSMFNPTTSVSLSWIDELLCLAQENSLRPKEFNNAFAYIKCAGNYPEEKTSNWSREADLIDIDNGINYHVQAKIGQHHWSGKNISFTIQLETPVLGKLLVWYNYPDNKERPGHGVFERRSFDIPPRPSDSQNFYLLELHVDREDCLDGVLSFNVKASSDNDFVITQVALVPR